MFCVLFRVCVSASFTGNVETAKLLIENGANINARDDIGDTPIHLAAEFGQSKLFAFVFLSFLVLTICNVFFIRLIQVLRMWLNY